MIKEHSFANYIRILGTGRNGARALTRQEAYEAMRQIYCYDIEPEQLGAFLMLMRVKEETAEEVAGFVSAIRESIAIPDTLPRVTIDWSSYAGKRRHMPWYLLAAMTLGNSGYPVFMHGMSRDDERIYTREALKVLGLQEAKSLTQAKYLIETTGFAYMDIANLSSLTSELIETRQLLGLRPPLHTVVRMLNPFAAPLMLQGVFHPNYAEIHQTAAKLLGQPRVLAFKGEGGEIERIPERAVKLYGLTNDELWQQEWPGLLPPDKYVSDRFYDWDLYKAVWAGEQEDGYATQAIVGTIALILHSLGDADTPELAHSKAQQIWYARHRNAPLSDEMIA